MKILILILISFNSFAQVKVLKVGSTGKMKATGIGNWKPIPPKILPIAPNGVLKMTTANTASFPSLYYPKMYKSAPFKPYFSGITKDYIFLYSTDHAGHPSTPIPANGAIGWGQCDSANLAGYVDMGIIVSGYQSETPSLIINKHDPNGEYVWFFYHPGIYYPGSGGLQQTRLWTTAGGVGLNSGTTWADRGKILGLTSEELTFGNNHTGYSDVYINADSSFTAIHITSFWWQNSSVGVPRLGKSNNTGYNYTFTREDSKMDIISFMPFGRLLHHSPSLYFKRNGKQYIVARNATFVIEDIDTNNFISIYEANGNYYPTKLLGNISGVNSGNNNSNAGYYIEGDTLYIYYIKSKTNLYVTTWDLKNLD